MLSHDFARELLKRRNNDLRFVLEVCPPGSDEDGDVHRTRLADDRAREVYGVGDDVKVLEYSSEDDMLDVMLGPIFLGDPDEKAPPQLSGEEWLMVVKALETQIHRISHLAMDKAALDRFTQLRRTIREAL